MLQRLQRALFVAVAWLVAPAQAAAAPAEPIVLQTSGLRLELSCRPGALWTVRPKGSAPAHAVAPPVFPLDGHLVEGLPARLERVGEALHLGSDLVEHRFRGVLRQDPSLELELRFRLSDLGPVVRFQYRLSSARRRRFSRAGAVDQLVYLSTRLEGLPRVRQVTLSESVEGRHRGLPSERPVSQSDFVAAAGLVGPILTGSDGRRTLILAYEHASRPSDAFVRFDLGPERQVTLRALKGSYWQGQPLDATSPYETLWLQLGLVAGDENRAADAYRRFVREEMAADSASRQPRALYDDRRSRKRTASKNGCRGARGEERLLAEVEVAARMGVETFVVDSVWQERADNGAAPACFPRGLGPVRQRLAAHGMALGLWLSPAAAASSQVRRDHRAHLASIGGATRRDAMCLVSPWGERFLQELVRLHRETGATTFRWEAVSQYGCDAAGHGHGTEANSPKERADAYAFRIGLRLAELAERFAQQIPGVVVDFEVGDGGSALGLALFRAGRCLLSASGPSSQGHAGYDRWIPAELFPAHGFPDGPSQSQPVNLASLVLGRGGIRGDLLSVSPEGVTHVGRVLSAWRQVRDAMASASPVRVGMVGGGGEVHERLDGHGRGGIVVVSSSAGRRRYVSEHVVVPEHWATAGTRVSLDASGRAVLDLDFEGPGAAIVFFGATER